MLPTQLKSFLNRIAGALPTALKNPKLILFAGLCGMLLIFLSSLFTSEKQEQAEKVQQALSAQEYCVMLENSVRELVADVTGDTSATVVITLESGVRYSYADATEITSSSTNDSSGSTSADNESRSYITVRTSDGGEQALLITELMPRVRGVAIICAGGDDEQLAEKIRGAVTAAFDITSKRVYIAGGNNYEKR